MKQKTETENGFKQTEIGSIPEDWETAKINEAYSFTKKPPRIDLSKYKRIPFIPMEFVPDDGKDLNRYEFREKVSSGTFVCKGDLIVAKITPSFENGKQAIVRDIPFDFVYATTEVWPIHEIEGQSNIDYLFYYLKKPDVRNDVAGKMEGSTGRQRVPKNVLENLTIPFPTLKEQQKIASVLSKIQQVIEHQNKIIEKTKVLKRSLMHRLFTYGMRGEELKETEIGTVPIRWNKKDLEQVADIVYGAQAAVAHALDSSIGTPIFTNINITNEGQIDLTTLRYYKVPEKKIDRLMLKKGDILFNWRSGSKEHVGKTALFELDGEFTFSSFILRFRASKDIHNRFLVYYLYYLKSIGYFSQYRDQSSVNSVFNASASAKIPVFVPEMDEQKEIAAALNSIDRKIGVEKCRSNLINALFRTMLNNLMTGQVRVKDIDFGDYL